MGRTGRGLGRRPTTRREGSRPRKPKMQLDGGGLCVCPTVSQYMETRGRLATESATVAAFMPEGGGGVAP